MAKILKNTTGSIIELDELGISIPASGQYEVPHQKYLILSTDDVVSELTTLINAGDVVVNDGSSDLSPSSEAIAFLLYPDDASNIKFTPTLEISENTVQEAIGAGVSTALNTPRYTIPLIYNGTLSNNEFIGYSNLLPGDDTPIVIPVDSTLEEYTFSNKNNNADFTIELRKNGTTASVFNTRSVTNTQSYVENSIGELFSAGDTIYIKYIDDGSNASDSAIILVFKAEP